MRGEPEFGVHGTPWEENQRRDDVTYMTLTIRRRIYNKAGKKLSDDTWPAGAYDGYLADRVYTVGTKEVRIIGEDGEQTRYTRGKPIEEPGDESEFGCDADHGTKGIDDVAEHRRGQISDRPPIDHSRQVDREQDHSVKNRILDAIWTRTRSFRKPAR